MSVNINQGNVQENITSGVILKLYLIATAAGNSVTLSGNLYSPSGYAYLVDYLNTLFAPNLTITVPDNGKYIYFEDSAVEEVLKSGGFSTDGIGISVSDVLQKTTLPSRLFFERSDIVSFSELSYFRNLITIGNSAFKSCTNLNNIALPQSIVNILAEAFRYAGLEGVDINLPSLTNISWGAFLGTSITKVSNLGSVLSIPDTVFNNCSHLVSVNLPITCTSLGNESFISCSLLEDINVENIIHIDGFEFGNCLKLTSPMYFKSLESVGTPKSGQLTILSCLDVYLPKLKELCGGYDTGGNSVRGLFCPLGWSRYRSAFNVVYLKDVTKVPTGAFSGATIRNLIINNSTPPTVTVYDAERQSTLVSSSATVPIANVYVPDGAVSVYESTPYWSELTGRYKSISQIDKVATIEAFNELSKIALADTLIEEYMN